MAWAAIEQASHLSFFPSVCHGIQHPRSNELDDHLDAEVVLKRSFQGGTQVLCERDTVRQFMEAEMRPILREYEREEKFPAEQIRKLGDLGCCGMLVPEEWGGAGTDTVSYAVMLEEVARVCASTAVAISVTSSAR